MKLQQPNAAGDLKDLSIPSLHQQAMADLLQVAGARVAAA
jgi:hypothetical protein